MDKTINYHLSTDTWGQQELDAIQRVIDSKYFTQAKQVKQFEQDFATYNGAKYAVMVNSGSSANLLAVASLIYSAYNLNPGDTVIVPAVSWSTTYYPLTQMGLKLRFVDIDIHTLNVNMDILEQAITPDTRAIMGVNLLGNPLDFERLDAICQRHDLILIEDNCESLGATFKGKFTGTFGVVGTYSTFYSHHICTIEGGVVVTDDEDLYHIMLSMRSHGWLREQPQHSTLHIEGLNPFDTLFTFILPGYNIRNTELAGAIGVEQVKKLPDIMRWRQNNAKTWIQGMRDNQNFIIQQQTGVASWFGFSIVLQKHIRGQRHKVLEVLEQKKVETRPIVAGNFVKNPVIRHLPHTIYGDLKNADYIHENGLFIGNSGEDCTHKIKHIINVLKTLKFA